jgi:hypothetical protein
MESCCQPVPGLTTKEEEESDLKLFKFKKHLIPDDDMSIYFLLLFQRQYKLPFHHRYYWYSCADEAIKINLYFYREQCPRNGPSTRCVGATHDMDRCLDKFGKNSLSFEGIFSIW